MVSTGLVHTHTLLNNVLCDGVTSTVALDICVQHGAAELGDELPYLTAKARLQLMEQDQEQVRVF